MTLGIMPRLQASGADMSRVFFVGEVKEGEEARAFDPARDAEALRAAIAEVGNVKLILVDPIVSAVSGDSHKNSEVRRALQPLANLAATVDAALIGITHFTKGTAGREPIDRINGSIAFGALARVVIVAARESSGDDGSTGRRILARAKSNIGPDDGGFAYDLIQEPLSGDPHIIASIARFGERIEGTARQILAVAETQPEDGGAKSSAEAFLADFLAHGPKTIREIRAAGEAHGISWRTMERAKASLGVRAIKTDFKAGWSWGLDEERHQDRQVSPHQKTRRPSDLLAAFVNNQWVTRDEGRQDDAMTAKTANSHGVGAVGGLRAGYDGEEVEF
jgi:hypothetical protein